MDEYNKILKAFSAIGLDDEQAGEAIQSAFDEMYDHVLQHCQKELSQILEDFVHTLISRSDLHDLYDDLRIAELLEGVSSDREDDFESLKKEFDGIYKKKNLRKSNYAAQADAFPDTNHWFNRNITRIGEKLGIKKENTNEGTKFTISDELITMLYRNENAVYSSNSPNANDPVDESLFQVFVSVIRKNVPFYWKFSVYVYFLGEYVSNVLGDTKQFSSFSFATKPSAKNFYEKVVTLIVTEYVSFRFSGKNPDWNAYLSENKLDFVFGQLKNYYGEKGLFKSEFISMIKGSQVYSKYKCRLRQVHIASVMCFLRKNRDSDKKNLFFKEIGVDPISNWSIAACFLNEPTEEELRLKEILECSVCRKDNALKLFVKTGAAATGSFQSMEHRITHAKQKMDEEDCRGKRARGKVMASLLCDLIHQYDNLNVEIPKCTFPEYTPDGNFTDHIVLCLKTVEKKLLASMKSDIFYAHDILHQQYDAVREGLKSRSFVLNTHVSSIYAAVVRDVEQAYLKDKTLTVQMTVQDLLSELDLYFLHAFRKALNSKSEAPSLVHKNFFESCELLGNVMEDERFLSCAAHGFLRECENRSAQEIVLALLCCVPAPSKKGHLDFCSESFLNFASVAVLGLPTAKKRDVIKECAEYINTHVNAENRAEQKMLILLLNEILIQADCYLDAQTVQLATDAIYKISFYPEQMVFLKQVMSDPFSKNVIEQHILSIQDPKTNPDGTFPSPFYLYLATAELAWRERNSGRKSCLKLNKKKISMENAVAVPDVDSFYKLCLLTEGVEWRTSNRTDLRIEASVFRFLIQKAAEFWIAASPEKPDTDLLKLTWGSQLLLTFFSDSFRKKFLDADQLDLEALTKIALMSDLVQRMWNGKYGAFIDGDDRVGDFWLISGAFRFACLEDLRTEKISFFAQNEAAAKFYCRCLRKEKDCGNHRFYVLLTRLLSKTDFFDVIGRFSKTEDLMPTRKNFASMGITKNNYAKKFLAYDKIQSFLEPILNEQ